MSSLSLTVDKHMPLWIGVKTPIYPFPEMRKLVPGSITCSLLTVLIKKLTMFDVHVYVNVRILQIH